MKLSLLLVPLLAILMCLFSSGSASNLIQPICVCTRELNPTCGTDGVTYSNPCVLKCAAAQSRSALKMAHPGEC